MPGPSSAILDRLTGLHPKLIDLSLGRIERLLDRLGRPQDRLPPVVHVAGTNGKGSTVAFLRAILEAAGRRVHVYTSPHLVRFSERIVVAGREINDAALTAILEECEAANAGEPITFFEITTAAAFLAFARVPADATLLETGLGGRLDATNVVVAPVLTAVTPVSLDHQEFLGGTLAAIAGEKAGILKPGVPCVLAAQPDEAARVIRARAAEVGAPLLEEGRDWTIEASGNGLLFASSSKVLTPLISGTTASGLQRADPQGVGRQGVGRPEVGQQAAGPVVREGGGGHARAGPAVIDLPSPGLTGEHQQQNAGVALACALMLAERFGIDGDALVRGLAAVRWPARLQRLGTGPLAALLPEGWELWLDGGHNPGAAHVLARHLADWRDRPCHLVFGMLKSKDVDAFLAPLAPQVASLTAVAIPGEANSLGADEAAAAAVRLGIDASAAPTVAEALRNLARRSAPPGRVLICGSLYLAGSVLRASSEM